MSSSAAALGSDGCSPALRPSRYESQKRRDWQTFTQYLAAHRPPLELRRCSGAHVIEFLRYLDRFGKTRVHEPPCQAYGGGNKNNGGCARAAGNDATAAGPGLPLPPLPPCLNGVPFEHFDLGTVQAHGGALGHGGGGGFYGGAYLPFLYNTFT
ncbi:hypothetical protein ABZP36_000334 [Zizania latifolia]